MRNFLRSFVAIILVTAGTVTMPVTEELKTTEETAQQEVVEVQEEKPAPAFYTYEQLWIDIDNLSNMYPQFVQHGVAGNTVCGREIPYVILGNSAAPKKILITSSIHAREYTNTEVVMKIIEEYATSYSNGQRQEVLDKTCFYIIPNCNPDGVALVQYGIEALEGNTTCYELIDGLHKKSFGSWKSNANGVDLNRNWDASWEVQTNQAPGPGDGFFKGYSANSENEIQAILHVMGLSSWDAVINFHQKGNVIYCGSGLGTDEYNSTCYELAKKARKLNGYSAYPPGKSNVGDDSYGTFGDYLALLNIPYITLETGTSLRSQSQIPTIYNKNVEILSVISDAL